MNSTRKMRLDRNSLLPAGEHCSQHACLLRSGHPARPGRQRSEALQAGRGHRLLPSLPATGWPRGPRLPGWVATPKGAAWLTCCAQRLQNNAGPSPTPGSLCSRLHTGLPSRVSWLLLPPPPPQLMGKGGLWRLSSPLGTPPLRRPPLHSHCSCPHQQDGWCWAKESPRPGWGLEQDCFSAPSGAACAPSAPAVGAGWGSPEPGPACRGGL